MTGNEETETEPKPFGRPALFKTAKELEEKIQDYIENCPDKRQIMFASKDGPPHIIEVPAFTISGLSYFLGFESRQSFYDYEEKDNFTYIIKRARNFIEKEYEKLLQSGQCTGSIFALKNMGWSDKTEIESVNTIKTVYIDPDEKKEMNSHIDEVINDTQEETITE